MPEGEIIKKLIEGILDPLGNIIVVDAGDIVHGIVLKPEIIGGAHWVESVLEAPDSIYQDGDITDKLVYERVFRDNFGNEHIIIAVVKRHPSGHCKFKTAMRPDRKYYRDLVRRCSRIWPDSR